MESLLKIIDGLLKNETRKAVLELGCGNGQLLSLIEKRYPHLEKIVGIDLYNAPSIIPAKVQFIRQDLETLTLTTKFDLVILNHVFEHIKDPLGLIERIKKFLHKNGRILIVVPNRKGFNNEARVYLPEHGKHYFLWDKESLEYSLERLNFICRFHNLYSANSHNVFLKYLPALLRLQNPNLICMAMLDSTNDKT